MTTGNRVVDNRHYENRWWSAAPGWTLVPIEPPKLVGDYYSRTWSGTDRPHTERVFNETHWWGPDGRRYKSRHYDKPPKRLRRDDDHPYSCQILHVSSGMVNTFGNNIYTGQSEWQNHQTFEELYGEGYSLDPSVYWENNDTLALMGKLRQKIVGSDFNAGVFLAEAKPALRMVADGVTSLASCLFQLKRGNFVGAARSLSSSLRRDPEEFLKTLPRKSVKDHWFRPTASNVSSRWLELQYGVKPLMSDIANAAEAAAKILNEPFVQNYKVRRQKPLKMIPVSSNLVNPLMIAYESRQIIARVSEVDVPGLIGLTDPWSILWEVTPYSFVLDWALPIGSFLSARSLNQDTHGIFVTSAKRVEIFGASASNMNNQFQYQVLLSPYFRKKVTVTRSVATNLDVPLPNLKPWTKIASVGHVSNALALLTQVVLGRSKS